MSVESEEKIAENTIDGNNAGTVKIANDVVATIAGLAAADVDGIAGMSGGVADGIADMLGRKNLTKGVKVDVDDQDTTIDIFTIVDYGVSIADVAEKVQVAVKEAVENMTGLVCAAVNVHVQGVNFPEAETAETEAE